jgi:hypothetical protein
VDPVEDPGTLMLIIGSFLSFSTMSIFFSDDVSLSKDFSISFEFRTYRRDGLLFALVTSEDRGLVLQQNAGEVRV